MTAQHTQGPWVVGQCTWNEEGNVCYELRGIKHGSASEARLIAAAPDLLRELAKAREELNNLHQSFLESSTNSATGMIQDQKDLLYAESTQDLINSIDAAITKATEAA